VPATPEEIEALRDSPQEMSGDTGTVRERSADDFIKLDQYASAAEAVDATNVNGGPRSAWHCLRPARVQLPGAR
jgi:hypothetical protein